MPFAVDIFAVECVCSNPCSIKPLPRRRYADFESIDSRSFVCPRVHIRGGARKNHERDGAQEIRTIGRCLYCQSALCRAQRGGQRGRRRSLRQRRRHADFARKQEWLQLRHHGQKYHVCRCQQHGILRCHDEAPKSARQTWHDLHAARRSGRQQYRSICDKRDGRQSLVVTGPHIMIVGPGSKSLGLPETADADPSRPYMMWPGTPYEHAMIPVAGNTAAKAMAKGEEAKK